MKKLISLVIFVLLLGVVLFNKNVLIAEANQILYYSPCATPKTFRIGSVDSRFDITKNELIADAQEAASAWKNNQGTILLKYDPNSDMPINMVYDQRQALNSQINNLNTQVTQQKDTLKPEISSYEQQVAQFKQKSDALNQQIQYWNGKGGAPADVYSQLTSEQQALQKQAAQLQQMANQLNQSTDQYNSQINQLNQKVDTFNNVLTTTPEEGEYIRDGTHEQINIYITNSQQELIHTLAHEMGHSLGLGHNGNPNSIMYPYTNTITTPSINDENALAVACQKQFVGEIAAEDIASFLSNVKQNINAAVAKY
jgi:peptidoglycan hydrolase CwlO-like protein